MYRCCGKRLLDALLSALALVLALPLLVLVALLVGTFMGRPVLFRHRRPGQGGRPFTLLKFRTMTERRGPDGALLPDADRLTPLGQFLRATSLDELPELVNVLKGQMSLVGPRPLLMQYLERYTLKQARRLDVRPGITGRAQVNGRNALTWEEKFALDVWYVDHVSLWLDVRILFVTVLRVVARKGISQAGHATAHEFRGTGA